MTAREVYEQAGVSQCFRLLNEDNEEVSLNYMVTIRPRDFAFDLRLEGGNPPVSCSGLNVEREEACAEPSESGQMISPGYNIVFACTAKGCERQFVKQLGMRVHNTK